MQPTALVAKILQDIRASYWFIPSLLVFLAVILSIVMQGLDRAGWGALLPLSLQDTQAAGARAVLSVIAQSVIGVAGVMFSMTVVAVSFASSNFGPRLIGNFMRDRSNQISLGVLISTFVYTMMILRAVQDSSAVGAEIQVDLFVPHLSVGVAIVLALVCVVTMILFVHHIPEAINLANISAGLGARLVAAIKQAAAPWEDVTLARPDDLPVQDVPAGGYGYMRTLNAAKVSSLAQEQGWWIEVLAMPGDFLDAQGPVFRLYGGTVLNHDLRCRLQDCYALGHERTEDHNMMFIVQQLCEVIARALSPGINDPFTAINCMNWLHVGLRLALSEPPGHRGSKYARVDMPTVSFTDLLREIHGTSMPYIATDLNVTCHVLGLLGELAARAPVGPRHDLILEEKAQLLEMALALQTDPGAQRRIAVAGGYSAANA